MRWIDRGPEPDGVAGLAKQYTQGWVGYYDGKDPIGRPTLPEPEDHEWSYFRETLGKRSNSNCSYCERQCKAVGGWAPTVDHFRPRSLFSELTYQWSNWIFSCRRCNEDYKKDKWASSGYVNPCASQLVERPERYFDYDESTGDVVPKHGISGTARQRALDTIDALGLSKRDLVNPRFSSIRKFKEGLAESLTGLSFAERQGFVETFLKMHHEDRVDFLVYGASEKGESIEYPGLKAMVAEKLLRDNSF